MVTLSVLTKNFTDGGVVNVSAVHAAGQFAEIHRARQSSGVPRQLQSQVITKQITVYNPN